MMGMRGLGLRFLAYDLGFRVKIPGNKAMGSGFRVQGLGFRVQGSGVRVYGLGFGV